MSLDASLSYPDETFVNVAKSFEYNYSMHNKILAQCIYLICYKCIALWSYCVTF